MMIDWIASLLLYLGSFIVVISFLIAFHEFGHFWVARQLGVNVLQFSIGFGKVLWEYTSVKGGTRYTLAAIPLGGFVMMLGEDGQLVPKRLKHKTFASQSVWRRMAIIIAGPLFNFLLAILLFSLVFMLGEQQHRPYLSAPLANSFAQKAGIIEGDLIRTVNNQTVSTWNETLLALMDAGTAHNKIAIEVESNEQVRQLTLLLPDHFDMTKNGRILENLGLRPWYLSLPAIIDRVVPESASDQAGLQPQDIIIAVDHNPIKDWSHWVKWVRDNPNKTAELLIERQQKTMTLHITPNEHQTDQGIIGRVGLYVQKPVTSDSDIDRMITVQYVGFSALYKGLQETWVMTELTVKMLTRMVLGIISWDNISGPLTIAQVAGDSVQLGWTRFLGFMALLSVSLGVLNLLPIPVLDGGHLLYCMIEVLKGSPVSQEWLERGRVVGVVCIGLLIILALRNDVIRLFYG